MTNSETAQKAIVAALAQHSAYLYRASTSASNELIRAFNAETKRMISALAEQLDDLNEAERMALTGGQYTTKRLKEIKAQVDSWASAITAGLSDGFAVGAVALAGHELSYIAQAVNKAIGEQKEVLLKGDSIYKAAKRLPVAGGQLIDEMMAEIPARAQKTVWNTIRSGVSDGRTNAEIIKALRGKAEFNYQDSVLEPVRKNITEVVRTARSHISNTAYIDTYAALGIEEVVVCATLDSRTSLTCAGKDGKRYKAAEPYPRPPYHRGGCRTVVAPVFDDGLIGNRPAKGSDGVTQVNANTSYPSWFKNQSAAYQKDWLGPSRYELYKKGGYEIDRFVDPLKGELSLNELKLKDQRTFAEVFG